MNLEDRRIKKTKKALQSALAKLLKEKDLHSITIKELTETADIHRATFYVHYRDLNEMYSQMEDEILSDLALFLANDPTHSYSKRYRSIVDYVYENAELTSVFFHKNSNTSFRSRVSQLLEQQYLNLWMYETNTNVITEQMRLITTYHIQGCIGIIEKWIQEDFITPKETIVSFIKMVDYNIENL